MTPDTLEDLILAPADPWELQRAFAALDEKARSKLSSVAQRLHRQLNGAKTPDSASDRLKEVLARRVIEGWRFYNSPENINGALALFALGPFSAVTKRGLYVWGAQQVLERILEDRRPPWIDDWIAQELEQDVTSVTFPTVRAWVKAGVCAKPTVDGYTRMFAMHLMRTRDRGHDSPPAPPISRQLLDDPALLDDVPGIFRVETIAFNTNSWQKAWAAPDHETWPEALAKLSVEGHLDRAELLRLALGGLRRDIKENQLSGLHRFYASMAPAPEELLQHQPDFVDLLCHPVGHVAKFAIEMLTKLEKQAVLDTGPVLREVQSVFAREGKGNATAALKLIGRIVARDIDGEVSVALSVAAEALRHVNPDVQAKALDLLEANAGRLERSQLELIGELESFVAASNRNRVRTLADASGPDGRLEDLDRSKVARPVEIEAYRLISGDIVGQEILRADTELTPIASFDELIDAALHAVEVVSSPDGVELILDGISRLADQAPADFDARVAPLLHRLEKGHTGANGLGASRIGVGLAVIDVVFSWARGRLYQTDGQYAEYLSRDDAFVPMIVHLRDVAARVARQESRLLLSAPTHGGGWIDPVVWVDRLRVLAPIVGLERTMDFQLSLLRLAPDRRQEALGNAAVLPTPLRRIVTFALGGEAEPTKADRGAYAVWISAARCRAPFADWSAAFAPMVLNDTWPDSVRPAEHSWRSSHKTVGNGEHHWKLPEFHIAVNCPPGSASPPPEGNVFRRLFTSIQAPLVTDWRQLPSAALSRRMESKTYFSGDLSTVWVSQWLAYIWPLNPTGAQMKGANMLAQRTDEGSSNWTPGFGFLQSLFQRNRPWGEAGHLLLCMGLIGRDADAKGLAIDALIEGIDGRLFDPEAFAAVMTRLCEGEWIKLNRLGEVLTQVVQVSPLHAQLISEALQAWIPHLDFGGRGAFHILEVLVETQAITLRPLANPARAALQGVGGSGKAAKLAKSLLGRV